MRFLHNSLTFIVFVLLCTNLNAQTIKATTQTDSLKADSLKRAANDSLKWSTIIQSLEGLKEQLAPKGDSALRIGQFRLFKTVKIPIYALSKQAKTDEAIKNKACDCPKRSDDCDCKAKTAKVTYIRKVSFLLKEGTIIDVQVFTMDNKTFSNDHKPIELNKFNERCDLLKAYNGAEYEYIQLCDFLQWERQNTNMPPNSYFVLDSLHSERVLYRELGVTTILDMKLSADLLGAFGNVPNGLFQADVTLTQVLNSNNVKNKGLFYFNFMKLNFNLSKLDTRFRITPLDSNFYRMLLFQRAWLNGDATFNIFKTWITRKAESAFFVNVGGGFTLTEIALANADHSTSVMPYFFAEPGLDLRFSPNFSFEMNTRIINQYAPQIENPKLSNYRLILKPQLTVYWYPLSTLQTRMFARLGYNQDLIDKKLFVQMQFGYSMLLGDNVRKN